MPLQVMLGQECGVHCLEGHSDLDDEAVNKMRQRERHYLALLGQPDIAPREDED